MVQNEIKRIIVEFDVRRQQLVLKDRWISTTKLRHLINQQFGIKREKYSLYTLQIFDRNSNEYYALDDDQQVFDLNEGIEHLHRFRIVKKPLQSQKSHLLNNLQSTVGKLHHATKDIHKIQDLLGTLNQRCDILNQMMITNPSKSSSTSSYLFDPSTIEKDPNNEVLPPEHNFEDEQFESVSCCENTLIHLEHKSIPPVPAIIHSNQEKLLSLDDYIQTRIIPCKYAVRGNCHLGDKCLYLHDETCIRSAREWERRL